MPGLIPICERVPNPLNRLQAFCAFDKLLGNVQTVAAASEELAASVQEISGQVSSSSDIAQSAVTAAEEAT